VVRVSELELSAESTFLRLSFYEMPHLAVQSCEVPPAIQVVPPHGVGVGLACEFGLTPAERIHGLIDAASPLQCSGQLVSGRVTAGFVCIFCTSKVIDTAREVTLGQFDDTTDPVNSRLAVSFLKLPEYSTEIL